MKTIREGNRMNKVYTTVGILCLISLLSGCSVSQIRHQKHAVQIAQTQCMIIGEQLDILCADNTLSQSVCDDINMYIDMAEDAFEIYNDALLALETMPENTLIQDRVLTAALAIEHHMATLISYAVRYDLDLKE